MAKQKRNLRIASAAAMTLALGALTLQGQEPAQQPNQPQQQNDPQTDQRRTLSVDHIPSEEAAPAQNKQRANGQRRPDLPLEAYAVAPGAKFMVKLEEDLNTSNTPENKRFKVITLEPLEAGSGIYLPAGAEISGHVSRVEPAGVAGRAKLYLTFDEIHTRFGVLPIIADLSDVPGDKSVKVRPDHEGIVEGRMSTQQAAGQAAAEGAALGAFHGVKDKNAKEAGEGAIAGAIAAYLMESGRGHELQLLKGAKLELELERALYLVKE
jgi:hypothetical protein